MEMKPNQSKTANYRGLDCFAVILLGPELYYMPPDRVQKKKNNKLCRNFWVANAEKQRDYAENTPDYAEISTVNKIDNRTFACGVAPIMHRLLCHIITAGVEVISC